jgi:hypothetical protein
MGNAFVYILLQNEIRTQQKSTTIDQLATTKQEGRKEGNGSLSKEEARLSPSYCNIPI